MLCNTWIEDIEVSSQGCSGGGGGGGATAPEEPSLSEIFGNFVGLYVQLSFTVELNC